MKLLERFEDIVEAQDLARELEALGIPAYVSATNSHLFGRIQSGALKVALWIVLDHQFDDAKAYCRDRDFEVTTGLSPEEMLEVQTQTQQYAHQFFNRFLIYSGIFLLALIGAVALYVVNQSG